MMARISDCIGSEIGRPLGSSEQREDMIYFCKRFLEMLCGKWLRG